jgi:hypothetical protein
MPTVGLASLRVGPRAAALGTATALVVGLSPGPAGEAVFVRDVTGLPGSLAWSITLVAPLLLLLGALRLTHRLDAVDRRAIKAGFLIGVAVYLIVSLRAVPPPPAGSYRDAWTTFGLGVGDPYSVVYAHGGSLYPPPLLQLVRPLVALGWPAYLAVISAVELIALLLLVGPLAALVLLIPTVGIEVWYANINLVLALAIAWGFRVPSLWSFVLLTKISPGVGVIWFIARREWRRLALVAGCTTAIVAVSVAIDPAMWVTWLKAIASAEAPSGLPSVPLPLRIGLAAIVVWIGAIRGRAWVVPIAAWVAVPVLWQSTSVILIALIPLSRSRSPGGARAIDAVDGAVGVRALIRPS